MRASSGSSLFHEPKLDSCHHKQRVDGFRQHELAEKNDKRDARLSDNHPSQRDHGRHGRGSCYPYRSLAVWVSLGLFEAEPPAALIYHLAVDEQRSGGDVKAYDGRRQGGVALDHAAPGGRLVSSLGYSRSRGSMSG